MDTLKRIALALADTGLISLDDFVPPSLVAKLASEAQELREGAHLRPAGIGRGGQFQTNATIRSDLISWLEPATATPAQRHYLGILEELRVAINRHLFLGLFAFEGHLALYPPGACYRKHLDQFRDTQHRLVTVILYLNPDWRVEDGGQLRIYLETKGDQGCEGRQSGAGSPGPIPFPEAIEGPEGRYLDILPLGGRLV